MAREERDKEELSVRQGEDGRKRNTRRRNMRSFFFEIFVLSSSSNGEENLSFSVTDLPRRSRRSLSRIFLA